MSAILWLASYPRSGNTWMRVFLTNCRRDGAPAEIDRLDRDAIASDRVLIDTVLGVESALLGEQALRDLLPEVYRRVARDEGLEGPLKVHDAYGHTGRGEPLFPADASRGVIHIVRNPLDVAVSLSHFALRDTDAIIERMANPDETQSVGGAGLRRQIAQRLGSWSGHVASWMDQAEIPMLRVRYEDMLLRPQETFGAVARFAGLPEDPARIARAVAASRFDGLQAQEQAGGFSERPLKTAAFFRQGRVGGWREALTPGQVRRIVDAHAEVMERLGYIAPSGEILEGSAGAARE